MKSIWYLVLFVFIGCQTGSYEKKGDTPQKAQLTAENHPGKKLLESKCYACHNPTAPHDQRIGPPMIAIKKHYITEETSKGEFTKALVSFVQNPSEENAKMRGAVRKFGVMPKQYFKEEDLKTIAAYLYDFEIEEPKWFQEHWKEHQGNGKGRGKQGKGKNKRGQGKHSPKMDGTTGMNYALKTKQQLAKNLMGALQKGGTIKALEFCNLRAIPITDSMATAQNVKIKRVSNKPRNPSNKASNEEAQLISMFQQKIDSEENYKPVVQTLENGKKQFYAPIVTNQMCLQCHGTPNKTVTSETLETLKKRYPKDLALGYDVNQVRGLWSIQFD
jgi:cytochrome c2